MANPDTRLSLEDAKAYLEAHPEEIREAWCSYRAHPAGRLFQFISPSGTAIRNAKYGITCGCPTLIKTGDYVAVDNDGNELPRLTSRIRRFGIPESHCDITVRHFPKFVRIQQIAAAFYKERGWRL